MATGLARGAKARGEKIAFGDGARIIWDHHSPEIFRGNPNIARPGQERDPNVRWIHFHKGRRLYNRQDGDRWVWNYDFKAEPGEIYFDPAEVKGADRFGKGFVLIEPNVPWWKKVAPNKDWGREKYQALAKRLLADGYDVAQFVQPTNPLPLNGVRHLKAQNFRDALAILQRAALYIGPEGGMHHGAAAVGTAAVVIFGGFIPPAVTGYDAHANITGGAEACGRFTPCAHCQAAMAAISVDEVYEAAKGKL